MSFPHVKLAGMDIKLTAGTVHIQKHIYVKGWLQGKEEELHKPASRKMNSSFSRLLMKTVNFSCCIMQVGAQAPAYIPVESMVLFLFTQATPLRVFIKISQVKSSGFLWDFKKALVSLFYGLYVLTILSLPLIMLTEHTVEDICFC